LSRQTCHNPPTNLHHSTHNNLQIDFYANACNGGKIRKVIGVMAVPRKRFYLIIILILTVAFISASVGADYKYVGTKKSNKYHLPSCKWAMKIKPENLITFKSAKEAQAAGYLPCKVCSPSVSD
jgi:hypothetical protein